MVKSLFKFWYFPVLLFVFVSCNNDDEVPEQPTGIPNIQQYVRVNREAGSQQYDFEFAKSGRWEIFQGERVDAINMETPVATSNGEDCSVKGLDSLQRYYFKLKYNDVSQAVISETKVAVHGQPNLRDLGGIINKEGKSIVWGKLFRSGDLSRLTESDLKYLESIGIKRVIDFRFEEEVLNAPDLIPEGAERISLPVEDSLMHRSVMTAWLFNNDSAAFDTLLVYENKVFVTEFQDEFKSYFDYLEQGKTTLFHCSAGKDRAGFAAALLLYALDVDEETIMENYLKSNQYLEEFNQFTVDYVNSMGLNGDLLWPVLLVKREYLEAALNTINEQYGGMDNYLKNVLDVDVEKLKELYLEGQ